MCDVSKRKISFSVSPYYKETKSYSKVDPINYKEFV